MKHSILIIDDEKPAVNRLKQIVESFDFCNLVGVCSSGSEAVHLVKKYEPDIILLDIELGDMTGFDVLKKIFPLSPFVIFVTAYDEFAIKAFDECAIDYVLKPYTEERIKKAIFRAIASNKGELVSQLTNLFETIKSVSTDEKLEKNYFHVRKSNRIVLVKIDDVKFIRASGNYSEIFVNSTKHLIREQIGHLEEELKSRGFVRIHRSSIINISFLSEILYKRNGTINVKMDDNTVLSVSRSYLIHLQEMIELS